ncbi:MAG: HU family DNA-binding protein, partial [Pseudomonadota bacterium]
ANRPLANQKKSRLCLWHNQKGLSAARKAPKFEEVNMSKAEFIDNVAQAGDMSNAEAKRMVELVFGEIEKGLKRSKKDGKYTIGTFGTFTINKRSARKGRNPRTGEEIKIKASKSLRFRPSSSLKEAAGC